MLKNKWHHEKNTAEKVSVEWSHQRILSTHLKVRTTLHVSIIDSKCVRVKNVSECIHQATVCLYLVQECKITLHACMLPRIVLIT